MRKGMRQLKISLIESHFPENSSLTLVVRKQGEDIGQVLGNIYDNDLLSEGISHTVRIYGYEIPLIRLQVKRLK